jgi:uncharacterized coiled-coil protein SlyX
MAAVTPPEIEAAQARIAARDALVEELNRLVAAKDRAVLDAATVLTVAVDFECAAGLHRKTRTGRTLCTVPPRESLKGIDEALTAYYQIKDQHQKDIDALIERVDSMLEQFQTDHATVREWFNQSIRSATPINNRQER